MPVTVVHGKFHRNDVTRIFERGHQYVKPFPLNFGTSRYKAVFRNKATVKTFKKQNGEIWLLPANPDYQPIDGRECEVLGKVVAVVRQY